MYSWSQLRPSRVDWKISQRPSGLKYASAFSPPYVSWRMLRRCVSPGAAAIVGSVLGSRLSALGEPTTVVRLVQARTAVAIATAARMRLVISKNLGESPPYGTFTAAWFFAGIAPFCGLMFA